MEFKNWRVSRNINIFDSNPQKKYVMAVRYFISAEELLKLKKQSHENVKDYLKEV